MKRLGKKWSHEISYTWLNVDTITMGEMSQRELDRHRIIYSFGNIRETRGNKVIIPRDNKYKSQVESLPLRLVNVARTEKGLSE